MGLLIEISFDGMVLAYKRHLTTRQTVTFAKVPFLGGKYIGRWAGTGCEPSCPRQLLTGQYKRGSVMVLLATCRWKDTALAEVLLAGRAT